MESKQSCIWKMDIYPKGMLYEEGFDNNKPNGRGKWVFKNGN